MKISQLSLYKRGRLKKRFAKPASTTKGRIFASFVKELRFVTTASSGIGALNANLAVLVRDASTASRKADA
jgi:hypothetical protein